MQNRIDFNADAGQGFGIYQNELEYKITDKVSSINLSCGFHAGDPMTMKKSIMHCKENNIALGAHIGYHDLQGFGYREMELSDEEIEATVLYQLGAVSSFAKAYSLSVEHVRPHGAMYMKASRDFHFAVELAKAVKKFDKWMLLYLPMGEIADKVEETVEINVVKELLIDKNYSADKSFQNPIVPLDEDTKINRIRTILHSKRIKLPNGEFLDVDCDTIHFNSQSPDTLKLLTRANEFFTPTPYNYNVASEAGWTELKN